MMLLIVSTVVWFASSLLLGLALGHVIRDDDKIHHHHPDDGGNR